MICRPSGTDNGTLIETLPLDTPFDFSCRFSEDRYCIGSFDSAERLTACKSAAVVRGKTDQCAECRNDDPSQRCTLCRGKCDLPSTYCRRPHVVYLAAYTPNDVKVGVCWRDRYERRIAEQGALVAIPIAQADDGRAARQLEA